MRGTFARLVAPACSALRTPSARLGCRASHSHAHAASHGAPATRLAKLHRLQPATTLVPAAPIVQHLLDRHDLVPMEFDWNKEYEKHPEMSAYLGGHYGHDDKRMVSAYFLDKSYVDKVGTNGLKFRWDQPADTDYHNVRLVGVIHFSTGAAGPDAHTVHGGAIATVLDNNCGFILNGLFFTGSRTANLNINYRDRVPTGSPVAFRCKVDRMEGRKTWVSTALLDPQSVIERGFWGGKEDGPKVLAEATALMIHGSKHLDTSKVKSK